jgi:hypothetical protein
MGRYEVVSEGRRPSLGRYEVVSEGRRPSLGRYEVVSEGRSPSLKGYHTVGAFDEDEEISFEEELDGYNDMGDFDENEEISFEEELDGYNDMGDFDENEEISFDGEDLDGYIPTNGYDTYNIYGNEDIMRSSLNGYHTTGAIVPMAEDTQGFVLSSQNIKAPSRVGAEGLDIHKLAQELKDVESLDVNARKAEGLPDIENVDVAIIRATPYYARQIADSNLGYILKQSSVVQGSYVVGLYVGPDSLLFNTGMGARDLNIPHGARTARPAGIFTNTIFSSVLPAVDGNVVWAGGEEGDF